MNVICQQIGEDRFSQIVQSIHNNSKPW
jgi:hypothetical protein